LELLAVGDEIRAALRSYRSAAPVGSPGYPRTLEDLLRDPRVPSTRRHLRRVPADPMTGLVTWGLIRTPDGQIIGVHSLSEARPIKVGNFDTSHAAFEGKARISEWIFYASAPASTPYAPSQR
jgi:hypothetical protein